MRLASVLADLRAEGDVVDALVAELPDEAWATPTPAKGWTVAHQIAHLKWTDDAAVMAATDPETYKAYRELVLVDPQSHIDRGADAGPGTPPADLLARWRTSRARVLDSLAAVPEDTKVTWWFGPPLRVASLATARLMELWAHGLDIAQALRLEPVPTHRLRHVAHLGVRTRDFAFHSYGLTPPEPFRVELTGPGDELWTWGPDDAAQRVTGPALDFCLLTTQRVNRADTRLATVGEDTDRWLDIAQSFAGPSGPGRAPSGS